MVYPYAYVADYFWLKNRGLVVAFDHLDKTFDPRPGDPIVLASPEDVVFVTTIKGVERFSTLGSARWMSCGLCLNGFREAVNLVGWFVILPNEKTLNTAEKVLFELLKSLDRDGMTGYNSDGPTSEVIRKAKEAINYQT